MRQAGAYSGITRGKGNGGGSGRSLLPLARIKKIMKRSEGKMMISGEAPIIFCKACELFIEDLTKRSWAVTVLQGKRRTLHREDVASAVIATDIFDFLVDLLSSRSSSTPDSSSS